MFVWGERSLVNSLVKFYFRNTFTKKRDHCSIFIFSRRLVARERLGEQKGPFKRKMRSNLRTGDKPLGTNLHEGMTCLLVITQFRSVEGKERHQGSRSGESYGTCVRRGSLFQQQKEINFRGEGEDGAKPSGDAL